MYDYPVTLHQDDQPGVAVTCDDLPEFNSAGDDVADALRQSVDGIETALSIYVDQRRAIPLASEPAPGQSVVHLPAVTVAKIVLWNEVVARGMRKADLCRLLGLSQTQVDRLVDFLHTSKMEAIESALAALGKRLALSVVPYISPNINAEALRVAVEGVEDNNRVNDGRWSDWGYAASVAEAYDAPLCAEGQAVIERAIHSDGASLAADMQAVELAVWGQNFAGSFWDRQVTADDA